MKKSLIMILVASLLLLTSCDNANAEVDALKAEVESLKEQLQNANLKEEANDALEAAKKEIEKLKQELVEAKEAIQKELKDKDDDDTAPAEPSPTSTTKPDDPVSADEAMKILEPLGLHLEKKDNPEFQGVIANKRSQAGDVYFLFYAKAQTETKALELFQEKVNEESDWTKVKDGDDDKIYTIERGDESLLAVVDDEAFFFGKAQSLDQLKDIAKSLGVDLD